MTLAILGLGTAVPGKIVPQSVAFAIARSLCCRSKEQETWLPSMYDGTGINTRYVCLPDAVVRDVVDGTKHSGSVFLPTGAPDEHGPTTAQRMEHYAEYAPPLALASSQQALDRAGVSASAITHLITVSCTGFLAPGIDVVLIRGLGLPPTVQRTHVGFMGCHGALNGLRVARAFGGSEPNARVLLCATELCCLHYHYGWDPQRIIANAIFADGSAAIVGVPAAAAPAEAWRATASASCLAPNSTNAMTWTIGDHGFEMTLSKKVPGLIAEHLKPWMVSWLVSEGLSLNDVASWAVHPGGPRIISSVEEALGLPAASMTASRAVFAEYGNMSSPTVLFVLDRLMRANAPRPCVALGFGPGLMAEALLLR